ncbi:MAG TPA: exopolysaccharide biosynthesis polyprenyl glycosylphosphotransferase [Terriglobales bacterium]|nr:exopolysaccharide biosynthesis polyprenyl glycosylphosphotransferase [Terriglobales bacterium]
MLPSSAIPAQSPGAPCIFPSRLIPGALDCTDALPRKKPVSATSGGFSKSQPLLAPRGRPGIWATGLRPRRVRNVLIIGAGQVGRQLAHYLDRDRSARSRVLGFLDENAPIRGAVLGRIDDLACIARREFVDEIILTPANNHEATQRIIREARANQIDVKLVPECFGCDPAPVALRKYGNVPVLTLSEERIPSFRLLVKRGVDLVLSAIGLLLALPLLAIIGCVIKLDSPGPVLYRAPRLGLKGRRFLCFKFRTMNPNADALKQKLRARNQRDGPFFKMVADPRVTRAGRVLRRYSLDELPQLWNVMRGEMSLVGPRPHPIDDFERYDLQDLHRLEVLPGLTGLWQVTARGDPSFARNMELDREYIGRWTLGMDFRILLKTVAVVLRGEGA